jgi:hypothetical protein
MNEPGARLSPWLVTAVLLLGCVSYHPKPLDDPLLDELLRREHHLRAFPGGTVGADANASDICIVESGVV